MAPEDFDGYQLLRALAQTHFIPVVNHCWGTAITVALNLHLLVIIPPLPGGAHPVDPMLEYDTTTNRFRDQLLLSPLDVLGQMKARATVAPPDGPGLGVEVDRAFLDRYRVQ